MIARSPMNGTRILKTLAFIFICLGLLCLVLNCDEFQDKMNEEMLFEQRVELDLAQMFLDKAMEYKELSLNIYDSLPEKAYAYLDSVYFNLQKYHELSTSRTKEFINTQFELDEKVALLAQIEERQKINRLLNYLIGFILLLLIIIFFVISRMRIKINATLSELVKKNLAQITFEQKTNDRIKQQRLIDLSEDTQHLTNDQKDLVLFTRFCEWLETDKPYLHKDLDLNNAARELGTNRSYLSKAINSQGTRFTKLVNKYRVHEVVRILEDESDSYFQFTIQEIAQKAGFHTKSVFFEAFRKETGMTPNQFKESLQFNKYLEDKSSQ